MASLGDLKVLAKAIMNAAVDAELLGLDEVGFNLNQAFDLVVRRAVYLRVREEKRQTAEELGGTEEVVSGS